MQNLWSVSFSFSRNGGKTFYSLHFNICFQNVLLARCAWPSNSWGKWKPISCRRAPSASSMKSYYQRRYVSPVTSNPTDAERNGWCSPAMRSTFQSEQRSSLMGGPTVNRVGEMTLVTLMGGKVKKRKEVEVKMELISTVWASAVCPKLSCFWHTK